MLKDSIFLEKYDPSDDLEAQIAEFVSHNNRRRYHDGLGNLTPTDV